MTFRVRAEGGTPMPVSNDRYTNEFFSDPSPVVQVLFFRHGEFPIASGGEMAVAI